MRTLLAKLRSKNAAIRRENNKLKREDPNAETRPTIPTPAECCRPRLARELSHFERITPLGGEALKTILGGKPSVLKLRGSLIEGDLLYDASANVMAVTNGSSGISARPVKIIATFHPSYVQKVQKWGQTFSSDLDRMVRWKKNQLTWKRTRDYLQSVCGYPQRVSLERWTHDLRC